MIKEAHLVLADGTRFTGRSFGAEGAATGEAVFTTGMTGYEEVLTDPSYCGQIVTMTAPQIGNTGVNIEDSEARRPALRGFVVRELSAVESNWRTGDMSERSSSSRILPADMSNDYTLCETALNFRKESVC